MDYINLNNSLNLKIRDLITIRSSSSVVSSRLNKLISQVSEEKGFVNSPYLSSPNNRFVTNQWSQPCPYGDRLDSVSDLIKQSDSYKNWLKTRRMQPKPGRNYTSMRRSWPDIARPIDSRHS